MSIAKIQNTMNKSHPIMYLPYLNPFSNTPLISSTSTGTKIVRFTTPSTPRRFTVHEDLICLTSTLFSSKLQPNRKPLLPTSTCSICHDTLDRILTDIAFCAACGQNVHAGCIETWKQRLRGANADNGGTLPTCPMCRATWKNEPLLKCVSVRESLEAVAVQMYVDWLYTRTLFVPEVVSRKSDGFNVVLLRCWHVAAVVRDGAFRREVVGMLLREGSPRFWSKSVKWAFVGECEVGEIKVRMKWVIYLAGMGADTRIQEFVMDVFLAFVEPGWFREESAKWPEVFVREVGERLLVGGKRPGYEEIKKNWLERLKKEEEGDMVEMGEDDDGCDVDAEIPMSSGQKRKRSADEEERQMKTAQWTWGRR